MYDALVVGAGPAGSVVADGLAKRGFSVLIVEEHREVGRPIQCSGLVSPAVLELAGSSARVRKKGLRRATVHAGKESLLIESRDVKAVVIDRAMFDRELTEKAMRSGADIHLGTRAMSFEKDSKGIKAHLRSSGEDITVRSRILIGADGASSVVARSFGMSAQREVLGAFQAHIKDEVDTVRIWPEPSTGFFTWQIPMEEGSLIGTASPGQPSALSMVRRRFPGFEKRSISHFGGAIPIGYSKNIVSDRVALVGDAAVQVKPLSGGGLYPGLSAAGMLVESASRYLGGEGPLASYQQDWERSVGKEIKNGIYIRRIYRGLSDRDMEKIVRELNTEKSREIIAEMGDIDHPSLLARPLVKSSPKLLVFARHLLGLLI